MVVGVQDGLHKSSFTSEVSKFAQFLQVYMANVIMLIVSIFLYSRFCTGCSRLPSGGFAAIQPKFTITRVSYIQERSLPTAATCFHLLKLPDYPNRQLLNKNLHTAIVYGSEGFAFT